MVLAVSKDDLLKEEEKRKRAIERKKADQQIMSRGRLNKLAGQIGEYLVCAELGRRGLIATPFAGNVPTFDVLAADEQCRTVPIQVKASRSDNWPSGADRWMKITVPPKHQEDQRQIYSGPQTLLTPDLLWVCVAIAPFTDTPSATPARDRFFILTEADLQKACVIGYTTWMDSIGWKRPKNPQALDCRFSIQQIEQFENRWDLILERLHAAKPDASLEKAYAAIAVD